MSYFKFLRRCLTETEVIQHSNHLSQPRVYVYSTNRALRHCGWALMDRCGISRNFGLIEAFWSCDCVLISLELWPRMLNARVFQKSVHERRGCAPGPTVTKQSQLSKRIFLPQQSHGSWNNYTRNKRCSTGATMRQPPQQKWFYPHLFWVLFH